MTAAGLNASSGLLQLVDVSVDYIEDWSTGACVMSHHGFNDCYADRFELCAQHISFRPRGHISLTLPLKLFQLCPTRASLALHERRVQLDNKRLECTAVLTTLGHSSSKAAFATTKERRPR